MAPGEGHQLQISNELCSVNFRAWACFGSVASCNGFGRAPIVRARDADESPVGDTCSRRDRIREIPGTQKCCAVGRIRQIGVPNSSLASFACTQEGICDSVAQARVGTMRVGHIVISRGERIDSVRAAVAG